MLKKKIIILALFGGIGVIVYLSVFRKNGGIIDTSHYQVTIDSLNNVITKNEDGYYTNGVISYNFDNNRCLIKYNNSDSVLVDSEAINCLPYGQGKEYHPNGKLYYDA